MRHRLHIGLGWEAAAATGVVTPTNSVAPKFVDGTGATVTAPIVGQTYFYDPGTWTGSPTDYIGQVYSAGVAIGGESGSWNTGSPTPPYLVTDDQVGNALRLGVIAHNATGGTSAEALSTATSAVADIDLTNAITALTRGSASGVTPMTWTPTLANFVFAGYGLRATVYSNSSLSTVVQTLDHYLSGDEVTTPALIDDALAAEGLVVGATQFLALTVFATTPNGDGRAFTFATAISPTDAAPATAWSAANSDASMSIAGNTVSSTVAGDRMARANHGHSGTGDWSYTLTPAQSAAHMIGLSNLTEVTNSWVGSSANSIGWRNTDGLGFNTGGVNTTFTWINGDVITIRLKNNKLYIAKNGTYSGSMNPTTEVGGIDVTAIGSAVPAVSTNNSGRSYAADFTNWP